MRRFVVGMNGSASIPLYVKECRNVTLKWKSNADLPNPPVAVAIVDTHIDDLDDADQAAHDGAPGTVAIRDTKYSIVKSDMGLYMAYSSAQANANPEKGKAIVEGAGFYVVEWAPVLRSDPWARHGTEPGTLKLGAKAKKGRVNYYWQMCQNPTSPTPGPWTDLPDSQVCTTSVANLTPGMTYGFRYRTKTPKEGLSDWSSPIIIMVH
jgi:hypothetical protein